MKKIAKIGLILVLILFIPNKVVCKVPGYTCTPAPDQNCTISRPVDIQPLIVTIIERITNKDFLVKYSNYTEDQFIKNCNN